MYQIETKDYNAMRYLLKIRKEKFASFPRNFGLIFAHFFKFFRVQFLTLNTYSTLLKMTKNVHKYFMK